VRLIPVCEPLLLGPELDYAIEALRSGWISSSGRYLSEFEERFSRFSGATYGIATTSGTTALHLALRSLGIGEGDEVILPDFTMIAVLFAVLYVGARPVFVDAEPDTWNLDPAKVEERITPRTKALIAVHTYGHPCEMELLLDICRRHKILLVEDAAEAHGALYRGRPCGGFGVVGCFSFYGNKIITTGEGGMVVTSDPEIAERCRYYRNLCFSLGGIRDFWHDEIGFNFRMTNVQAALGLGQLERIEEFIARRRSHAAFYTREFGLIDGIQCPVEREGTRNVYWMFGILIDPKKLGMGRDEFSRALEERGIETRPFFRPMHRQKVVEDRVGPQAESYPVSDDLSERGLYLPSGSGLSEEDLKYITDTIKAVLASGEAKRNVIASKATQEKGDSHQR